MTRKFKFAVTAQACSGNRVWISKHVTLEAAIKACKRALVDGYQVEEIGENMLLAWKDGKIYF